MTATAFPTSVSLKLTTSVSLKLTTSVSLKLTGHALICLRSPWPLTRWRSLARIGTSVDQ